VAEAQRGQSRGLAVGRVLFEVVQGALEGPYVIRPRRLGRGGTAPPRARRGAGSRPEAPPPRRGGRPQIGGRGAPFVRGAGFGQGLRPEAMPGRQGDSARNWAACSGKRDWDDLRTTVRLLSIRSGGSRATWLFHFPMRSTRAPSTLPLQNGGYQFPRHSDAFRTSETRFPPIPSNRSRRPRPAWALTLELRGVPSCPGLGRGHSPITAPNVEGMGTPPLTRGRLDPPL
jgi:hypothetical protein